MGTIKGAALWGGGVTAHSTPAADDWDKMAHTHSSGTSAFLPCAATALLFTPTIRVFMFAGSLLVGWAVIMVAVWLEYHDSLAAGVAAQERRYRRASDAAEQEVETRYQTIRRRWRLVIHVLLALCGGLMIAAGWAGPGRFWIAAWTSVVLLMLCIVMIAAGDAIRTHHHHGRKLPQRRGL